jgi:hypothetical protein
MPFHLILSSTTMSTLLQSQEEPPTQATIVVGGSTAPMPTPTRSFVEDLATMDNVYRKFAFFREIKCRETHYYV